MVTIHGEPAYNRIEGKWILNCPYICVHRIAVDNEYKGKDCGEITLKSGALSRAYEKRI